jgi:glutathione synthase/RimK-type ligase-like ATP-grasp enzyme
MFDDPYQAFSYKEWRSALYALPVFTPLAKWINPIRAQDQANSKPFQLMIAARHGFQVPPTLFTNNAYAVISASLLPNTIIYKPHNFFIFPPDHVIFTSETQKSDVRAAVESVAIAPGIYQPLVEKSYELRITAIGEHIFAARVNSQEKESTRVDWRQGQYNEMFDPIELEPEIEAKLLRMQQELGLSFGVYDFIVDADGGMWFLEVNPAGQYLWLEERLGLPISNALATELLR